MQEERTHTKATREKKPSSVRNNAFVFFSWQAFAIFSTKKLGKKESDSVFCSVNSTNIANVIVKFRQNFETKFLFKKKH